MKKIISLLTILILSININSAFAIDIKVESENAKEIKNEVKKEITRWETFEFFADFYNSTPKSYKYIDLKYKWIEKWSSLEDALKKLVYHDKLDNKNAKIYQDKIINAYVFYYLARDILEIDMDLKKENLSKKNANEEDILFIKNTYRYLEEEEKAYIEMKEYNALWNKKRIFDDVYQTILNEHYKKNDIDKNDLIYSAIEWLTSWVNDKHTVYFPPIENKSFSENLEWEYEWIGAYVEMSKPWEVKITTPIPWWPAEKAWIKWGDIVTKVDWVQVNEDNSLEEVTSWIKWKKWTSVKLTILRGGESIEIEVNRDKIVIKNLEYEKLDSDVFYIKIKSFWSEISKDFEESLLEIKKDDNIKKIIIDLRNNGWWYLDQVVKMLWYLIDDWETAAVVKYDKFRQNYYAKWENIIDLNNYELVILQNSWTASASEIMIWTLQDYFDLTTIWEKTYGKGSVQTIKEYSDWSSLKYTIANWYTWLSETWIEWKWIEADTILELDIEKYNIWEDNQLEEALKN